MALEIKLAQAKAEARRRQFRDLDRISRVENMTPEAIASMPSDQLASMVQKYIAGASPDAILMTVKAWASPRTSE